MADSAIKDIVDAAATALGTITGIGLVTRDYRTFHSDGKQKYPKLYIDHTIPEAEWIAFEHATAHDMEGEVELVIEGEVTAKYRTSIDTALDSLLQNTIKKVLALSENNIMSVNLGEVGSISDLSERFGYFRATFSVRYTFNHNSP